MVTKAPSSALCLQRAARRGWRHRAAVAAVIAGLLCGIPVRVVAMTGGEGSPVDRAAVKVRPSPSGLPTVSTSFAPLPQPPGLPPVRGATTVAQAGQHPAARAGARHRVLAFLYPWFGPGAATDPALSVHPTTTLLTHNLGSSIAAARLARANGVDGFVLSFAGGARQGLALHQTLEAAAATHGTATAVIETREAGTADVVERWVRDALGQSDHPAFERVDGVPVLFAFASGTIPAAAWGAISDHMAAEGHRVMIIGDVTPSLVNRMSGQYRYNALMRNASTALTPSELVTWDQSVAAGLRSFAARPGAAPQLMVATVQAGWDDRPLRGDANLAVGWDGTTTYDRTWSAALAADPDWVVITSWNEWFEGTGIGPSVEHGAAALAATSAWATRFKLSGTTPLP